MEYYATIKMTANSVCDSTRNVYMHAQVKHQNILYQVRLQLYKNILQIKSYI